METESVETVLKPLRSYKENGLVVKVFPPMPASDFFRDHIPNITAKPKYASSTRLFD